MNKETHNKTEALNNQSRALHAKLPGKIETTSPYTITSYEELSQVYSPGVAAPCMDIADDVTRVYDYTLKGRTVAVVSDGSAVLGLGNIGPEAALPVMEGKAMLFKQFAGIDAVPICLDTQDVDEIVHIVTMLAPTFGGINLEDISAPRCFDIEERLQDIGIPVFHDDQHGTAIVVLAGLINAMKVSRKKLSEMRVVIQGAGAAGIAIARLLAGQVRSDEVLPDDVETVADIIMCDSRGIVHGNRDDLTVIKKEVASYTNADNRQGDLADALEGADVFIGVSVANSVTSDMVQSMNEDPIIFALANPVPEIDPQEATDAGALVIATGRSDFPNQVNNVLAFPGIFKGILKARAPRITASMKYAAAYALAELVAEPRVEMIIPDPFDDRIADTVAQAIVDSL